MRSRITMSSVAARAASAAGELDSESDEEPGEVIESAPPLEVGEERIVNKSTGLNKKLIKKGTGWLTPQTGDEVTVHYVGMFEDKKIFDSSRERGDPYTFLLGKGVFGSTLDEVIITMTKGELALFTLPCSSVNEEFYARWNIARGVDVQFEVELLSWLTVMDVSKDGGITKKILFHGDEVQINDLDEVLVKYKVKLQDETIVAESPDDGLWFHVNEGHLFPAFTKATKTMKRGENATVTVQPQYAFGEAGKPADDKISFIPSNAILIIEIELISSKPVLDVTGDMKVVKKILEAGKGVRPPNDGETVRVRYTAMLEDGTIFERLGYNEDLFEFTIDEEQVIAGLDRAVATMLEGEISQVTVKPDYGFGCNVVNRSGFTIPESSTLVYKVNLVEFIKEKDLWEMGNPEKIEAAERAKQMGNDLYKNGKFQLAAKKYDKAVNYISDEKPFEDNEEKTVKALRISCWLNHAACSIKLDDFQEAIKLCSKVLDIESCNVKALYRRAQASMKIGDLDSAKYDIQKALEVDSQNREVKSLQVALRQQQLESNKRDAKIFGNMFDRKKDTTVALKRIKVDESQGIERDNKEFQAT